MKKLFSMLLIITAFMVLSSCQKEEKDEKEQKEVIRIDNIKVSDKDFSWRDYSSDLFDTDIYDTSSGTYLIRYYENMINCAKLIDEDGTVLWEKENLAVHRPATFITNKGFILQYVYNEEHYFVHIDNKGNELWTKGPYDDAYVKYYANFKYVISADTEIYLMTEKDGEYTAVVLDDNGSEQFAIDVSHRDILLTKLPDNGYMISKYLEDGNYAIKLDEEGNEEWRIGPFNVINGLYHKNNTIIINMLQDSGCYLRAYSYNGTAKGEFGPIDLGEVFINTDIDEDFMYLYYAENNQTYFEKVNLNLKREFLIEGLKQIKNYKINKDYIILQTEVLGLTEIYKYTINGEEITRIESNGITSIKGFDEDTVFLKEKIGGNTTFTTYDNDANELFSIGPYKDVIHINKVDEDYLVTYKDNFDDVYVKKIDNNGNTLWEQGPYMLVYNLYGFKDDETVYQYVDSRGEYFVIVDGNGAITYNKNYLFMTTIRSLSQITFYAGDLTGQVDEIVVFTD